LTIAFVDKEAKVEGGDGHANDTILKGVPNVRIIFKKKA
jgi:hypothetical protein